MTKEEYKAEFLKAVQVNVEKGNHARWGNDESVSVIEKLVEAVNSDDSQPGFDAIRDYVATVVNPSAFAQKLEELSDGSGKDNEGKADARPASPRYIRRPAKATRSRGVGLE